MSWLLPSGGKRGDCILSGAATRPGALLSVLFRPQLPLYPFVRVLRRDPSPLTSPFPIYHPTAMARSTDLADLFRAPALFAQRHYEICKAYFLDQTPAEL